MMNMIVRDFFFYFFIFFLLFISLLTALIAESSHVLTGIYCLSEKRPRPNLKDFQYQILAFLCKLVNLILG